MRVAVEVACVWFELKKNTTELIYEKYVARRVLGRLSTNSMTLFLIRIHFETNIFLSTKVI